MMGGPSNQLVQAISEALAPEAFSTNPDVAHRAASPNTVESVRRAARQHAEHIAKVAKPIVEAEYQSKINRLVYDRLANQEIPK